MPPSLKFGSRAIKYKYERPNRFQSACNIFYLLFSISAGRIVRAYNRGREVARLRLPLIQDVLGRAAGRDAREQVRPRGVRVAEGLCYRAVFRNIPDVARRVVGIAEGRAAAVDLGRKLTQRVVGILLRQRRLGHVRAFGHDLRDVAGRIVGIGEAAKVRTALLVFQPS